MNSSHIMLKIHSFISKNCRKLRKIGRRQLSYMVSTAVFMPSELSNEEISLKFEHDVKGWIRSFKLSPLKSYFQRRILAQSPIKHMIVDVCRRQGHRQILLFFFFGAQIM